MNLRHGTQESPEINLTPLIDVVFLLLIFFMVSTTFQRDADLTIELPEAAAEKPDSHEDPIDVAIDYRGRFYVNGRQLVNTQMASVKAALEQAAGKRESPPLVISADAQTPHQAVITVMDAARQLGFLRLSFATRVSSAGEGVPSSTAE